MTLYSRTKGKVGELEVRDLFRAAGFWAERGQQRAGGGDSPDVRHNLPDHHVEVKLTQRMNLWDAIDQALRDKKKTERFAVFHRKNHRKWVVILDAEDWLRDQAELYPPEATSEVSHSNGHSATEDEEPRLPSP